MTTRSPKKYTAPAVATDVAMFTIKNGRLHVLLIKMTRKPFLGTWVLPGGLIKANESLDAAACRELESKTNIRKASVYLKQLYTFGDVDRDPLGRVISVAYYALIPSDQFQIKTTAEYGGVDWFDLEKLPPLAYDHAKIIGKAMERLRMKLRYSNIAYSLMPKEFTLTELQKTYEIILGTTLDKRNFRKKLFQLPMLKDADKLKTGEANRPARLYRFSKRSLESFDFL